VAAPPSPTTRASTSTGVVEERTGRFSFALTSAGDFRYTSLGSGELEDTAYRASSGVQRSVAADAVRRRQVVRLGRFGGRAALEELTELRWISVQQTWRSNPI
jgi:hypothetical protein